MFSLKFTVCAVFLAAVSVNGFNCTLCDSNKTITLLDSIVPENTVPSITVDTACGDLPSVILSFNALTCLTISGSNIPELCGCSYSSDQTLDAGQVGTTDIVNSTVNTSPTSNSTNATTAKKDEKNEEKEGVDQTSIILCLVVGGLIIAILLYMVYEYKWDVAMTRLENHQSGAYAGSEAKKLDHEMGAEYEM